MTTDRGEKDFFGLLDALSEWPKLPSPYILSQLGSYASKDHDDWERGKVMQRTLPMGRISFSHECEKGAGFWDRITDGAWLTVPHSDDPLKDTPND